MANIEVREEILTQLRDKTVIVTGELQLVMVGKSGANVAKVVRTASERQLYCYFTVCLLRTVYELRTSFLSVLQ